MVDITVEDFCQTYQVDPSQALSKLQGIPEEESAALLIDAGGIVSDVSLLTNGISRLEKLQTSEGDTSYRSFCIANGKQLRAGINFSRNQPINNGVLDDLFMARLEHSKVILHEGGREHLPSRSATNIANALLETGRWVEALDFFQQSRRLWRKNGVSALREMHCLMGFHNAARQKPKRYGTYSDLNRLYLRIIELSKIVEKTYDEISLLAGDEVVEKARHAVAQIQSPAKEEECADIEQYFDFVDRKGLALSLYNSHSDYEYGKIDTLSFEKISDSGDSPSVPEIFAMLNIMKADYALARQMLYESQFVDRTTIFRETVKFGDTLDYSLYGVQVSAMCTAQRVAYDILDKIAVAMSSYLKLNKPKQATFERVWYKYEDNKRVGLNEAVAAQITSGNRGFLALYDLHRDTTKELPEKAGFLRAIKEYRNSSTHRFTVLHDKIFGRTDTKSKIVDHEHVMRFEELTFSSIRLARAALFYFCDAINSAEEQRPSPADVRTVTHTVPDHDYIRGNIRKPPSK